ncbi:MAG: hypothetical protein GC204_03985 [Chloroflexi bacterium]|nr:hypothetical protein [Chloroflexota bacterium]
MKKIALLLLSILLCTLPAYAQDQQPASSTTAPAVMASDLFDKARTLLSAQKYDQAVLDLSLFILVNPTYTVGYYLRSQAYMSLNDLENALKDIDQAIATAPTNVSADYGSVLFETRGEIDTLQQQAADALSDFSQSIALKPTVSALANRALIYLNKPDYQSALTDLDSAIALKADSPALYVYRGAAQTGLKNLTAAATDYLNFFNVIQPNPTIHAAIQSGDVVTLQIDQGVVELLPFAVKAHQYVSALAVARSGNVDPLLVLIDAQSHALAGDDNGGGNSNALILNYQVAADGNYALVVGHSLNGFTGTVLVQFQISDQPVQ